MKRKTFISLLIILLYGSFFIVRIVPVQAKTFELKFHHHGRGKTSVVLDKYVKSIENATKGRVKITTYPSATLGKPKAAYELVTSGTADMAWGFLGFFPGQFPMSDIPTLPLLGSTNGEGVSRIFWALYSKFPEAFAKEYKEVKLLTLHSSGVVPTSTISKPISKMEDFKGIKIRTPAGPPTEIMKTLGASPMTIAPQGIYSSLEKGVIEACTFSFLAHKDFKLYEICDFFHDTKIYASGFWIIMNLNTWDSMPKDIQEQITSISGVKGGAMLGAEWDKLDRDALNYLKALPGKQFITYSADEKAKWAERAKPIWDAHVKKLEAKGLPGKEALEYTLKLFKQHAK